MSEREAINYQVNASEFEAWYEEMYGCPVDYDHEINLSQIIQSYIARSQTYLLMGADKEVEQLRQELDFFEDRNRKCHQISLDAMRERDSLAAYVDRLREAILGDVNGIKWKTPAITLIEETPSTSLADRDKRVRNEVIDEAEAVIRKWWDEDILMGMCGAIEAIRSLKGDTSNEKINK